MAHRFRYAFSALLFISVFSAMLTFAGPVHGRSIKKLSEDNITDFITKTSEVTSGTNLEMSPDEITDYLEKHLDKKARFKSVLKYNIPGFPAQETAMSLNKADFIESIEKGSEALSNYENRVSVGEIQISSDKTKATVKTTGFETGIMPMSADGETTQQIPVEGTSNCTQILMLNDGVIQMYSANCSTVINFSQFN